MGGRHISELPVSQEDEAIYLHLERVVNRYIRLVQRIQYSTGTSSNHAGTTDEFFFFEHGIFGFDMECGKEFQPPVGEAVIASLEVAQAAAALGWCATGATGLDIDALMRRRTETPVDAVSDIGQQQITVEPWTVEPLSSEYWPRYRVEVVPSARESIAAARLELLDQGYDLVGHSDQKLELIASLADVDTLLSLGYKPLYTKVLY